MAYRTLKVIRTVDGAEASLFETSLNETEYAELRATHRVADPTPGTPEFRELEEGEDREKIEGVIADLVLQISSKERRDRFEVYKAEDGWRFRWVAANGELVSDSAEAYQRKYDARSEAKRQAGSLEVREIA